MNNKLTLSPDSIRALIRLHKDHKILMEGSILKFIDLETISNEAKEYLKEALRQDSEQKRRQLNITEKVMRQNNELALINKQLEDALEAKLEAGKQLEQQVLESMKARYEADYARLNAERDLQTEFELKKARNRNQGIATFTSVGLLFFVIALHAIIAFHFKTETAFQSLSTLSTAIVGAILGYIGFYFKSSEIQESKNNSNDNKRLMV